MKNFWIENHSDENFPKRAYLIVFFGSLSLFSWLLTFYLFVQTILIISPELLSMGAILFVWANVHNLMLKHIK